MANLNSLALLMTQPPTEKDAVSQAQILVSQASLHDIPHTLQL